MKHLLRIWGMSILLIFCFISPVQAQEVPTPVPTLSPGAQTIIQQTTSAVDRYGIVNVVLFIILVVVLLVFLRIVVPLLNANTAANQQIAMMNQNSSKLQFDTVSVLQNISGTLTTIVNTLESKQDAHEDRLTMTKSLREHADDAVAPVKEVADSTLETVKEIETKLETLLTHEVFTEEIAKQLQPVRDDIAELRKTIEQQLLPTIRVVVVPPEEVPPTTEPPKDDPPSSSTIPGVPLS